MQVKLRIAMPVRLKRIWPYYRNRSFRLLDVGCGNHSPSVTRLWFPLVEYHGLDREVYNNDVADLQATDVFYMIDLQTELDRLNSIPDGAYDVILFSHVIEHLPNGLAVLARLCDKLRPGGLLYVETPSERSLRLPSMPGTLNFHDDPSHVRVYSVGEIVEVLNTHGLDVLAAGRRRDLVRVFLCPVRAVVDLWHGAVWGPAFWDVLGFANFVFARRRAGKAPGIR